MRRSVSLRRLLASTERDESPFFAFCKNAFKPLENIASQTDPPHPFAVCVCQAIVFERNYSAISRSIFSKLIITPHAGPAAVQSCAEAFGNSHAHLTTKDAWAQCRQKLLRRNVPQKIGSSARRHMTSVSGTSRNNVFS